MASDIGPPTEVASLVSSAAVFISKSLALRDGGKGKGKFGGLLCIEYVVAVDSRGWDDDTELVVDCILMVLLSLDCGARNSIDELIFYSKECLEVKSCSGGCEIQICVLETFDWLDFGRLVRSRHDNLNQGHL